VIGDPHLAPYHEPSERIAPHHSPSASIDAPGPTHAKDKASAVPAISDEIHDDIHGEVKQARDKNAYHGNILVGFVICMVLVASISSVVAIKKYFLHTQQNEEGESNSQLISLPLRGGPSPASQVPSRSMQPVMSSLAGGSVNSGAPSREANKTRCRGALYMKSTDAHDDDASDRNHSHGEKPSTQQKANLRGAISLLKDLRTENIIDKGFAKVDDFRLANRRERLGIKLGPKDEVSELAKTITEDECRLLPVAQQAQFRKELQANKNALLHNGLDDDSVLHLHFGAGRLGLGLVLPAMMCSGKPFIIVQRPSEAWTHALKSGQAEVRINGSTLATLDVASSISDLDRLQSLGKQEFIMLSDDPAVLAVLVSRATSYSCAIGGRDLDASLAPLVQSVRTVYAQAKERLGPDATPAPVSLYACENDHEAVEKLATHLAGMVDVVPMMVDRVCTSRDMQSDGSIDVATEPYVGDLVLSPPGVASVRSPIPFAGCSVLEPTTNEGFSFVHRKKILNVNGTHTTIAFLTLVNAEPNRFGPPSGSHELLSYDIDRGMNRNADQSVDRQIWVWAVARQLLLLYEFDDDVVRQTLSDNRDGCNDTELVENLLTDARTAVERLSKGGDQTSRVLGGGVENRWRTRLANVNNFLEAHISLSDVSKKLLEAAGVGELEMRTAVKQLVGDSRRFTIEPQPVFAYVPKKILVPNKIFSPRQRVPVSQLVQTTTPGVLFDFDGTLGDTEVPAMEVAFWEIAPYLPELVGASDSELDEACPIYCREHAGKAFEHMIERCNELRSAEGLKSVEETRAAHEEPLALLASVDVRRVNLGLDAISAMRRDKKEPSTLLKQQKDDTVARLAKVAQPTPGTVQTLASLRDKGVPFVIATTSGKPRVPVCVDSAGLRDFFPSDEEAIHSGESDFNPPKFKPDPDVYIRAASSVDRSPSECIAVEDSASGVGSASNAGIGLIVGYVGAGHIAPEVQKTHACMLMAGERAQNKRGADIVISHMGDLPKIVDQFTKRQAGHSDSEKISITDPLGKVYTRD
jgi:beta-phosphoglucomutase-like phosphatase (HAD superfamily)